MLYSNVEIKAEIREFDFGKINQMFIGEFGRGRKAIVLTCPEGLKGIPADELFSGYTLGTTKTGKFRVNAKEDNVLYLLVSSKGGYTRRGDGTVRIGNLQKDMVTLLAEGNGADGDAGRIGQWSCKLFRVENTTKEFVVEVNPGGGWDSKYIIGVKGIEGWKVSTVKEDTFDDAAEALGLSDQGYEIYKDLTKPFGT